MVPQETRGSRTLPSSTVPRRHVFSSRNPVLISDESLDWTRHRRVWRAGKHYNAKFFVRNKSGFASVIWAAKSNMSLSEKPWIVYIDMTSGRAGRQKECGDVMSFRLESERYFESQ
jgi:hypothetical protein